MPISEFEIKKCEKEIEKFLIEKRPPSYLRDRLDYGYQIKNQSVELFEIRPEWGNLKEKMKIPIVKATYVKKHAIWKIYWQRRDLKWHSYEPVPSVKNFEDFLTVVKEDEYACFFG